MLKKWLFPLVLLLCTAEILSFAQTKTQTKQTTQRPRGKPNIAILDFDARSGLSKEEAASLSDAFTTQLVKTGEFNVIDRNRLRQILQEQGFQQSEACSAVECVVEAGKILKVEQMFVGNIGKVGRTYSVNLQVVSVSTAQITVTSSRQHQGDIDELLTTIIPEMADEMATELVGKTIKTERVSSSSSSWMWYVGGAVLVGGGAAAVLLGGKDAGTTDGGTTIAKLPNPPTLP